MNRAPAGVGAVARVVVLLAGVAAVAGPAGLGATSAAAASRVAGTVRDLDGDPAADVRLALLDDGDVVATTATDDDGRFELAGSGSTVAVGDGETHRVRYADAGSDLELTALPARVEIERLAGAGRIETAAAAAQHGFADGADTALLASAHDWPDALAGAPLAVREGAPVLLAGGRLPPASRSAVLSLGAESATVLGAVGAVPLATQLDTAAAGLALDRIAGGTRTDTAALTARAAFPDGASGAIVATSVRFPDALAAGALAAVADVPVLLTGPDRLDADAAAAVADLEVATTTVVGGRDAVGPDVAADLPDTSRLSGPDRYATGARVAEEVLARGGDPTTVVVATGRDYPDALAGAVVAGRGRHPLVLLDGRDAAGAAAAWAFLERHAPDIGRIIIMGGTAAVDDDVESALATLDVTAETATAAATAETATAERAPETSDG